MRFTAAATALIMLASGCQPIAEPNPPDTSPPPPAPPLPPADGLGVLDVLTLTAGVDIDPDGYEVTVAGQMHTMAVVDSVRFSDLTPGPYDVVVDGLTDNCAVTDGSTTRSITLSTEDATVAVQFNILCQSMAPPDTTSPPLPPAPPIPPADSLGALEVLTLTAGDDADPDGYQVTVAGQTQTVAPVGSVQFSGLTPGPYDVVVDGLTVNCAVTDGMTTQSVTLPEGGVTVAVQFNILCQSVTPPDPSPPPPPNAPACYLNGTGCSEAELEVWEEAEKARIAAEQQASQPVYDSLKVEWDTYLHGFPQGQSQFLMCDPLQYTGDVKIVGPEGADMSIGPHKLRIPPGALTERVVITGVMPVSLLVSVELSPHGLQFAPGVTLELDYGHCDQPEAYQHRVAYLDGNGNVLEWPTSIDYSAYEEITADIDHFSKYAVAY